MRSEPRFRAALPRRPGAEHTDTGGNGQEGNTASDRQRQGRDDVQHLRTRLEGKRRDQQQPANAAKNQHHPAASSRTRAEGRFPQVRLYRSAKVMSGIVAVLGPLDVVTDWVLPSPSFRHGRLSHRGQGGQATPCRRRPSAGAPIAPPHCLTRFNACPRKPDPFAAPVMRTPV